MTRVKRSVTKRARRKKIIKAAKGFTSHRKTNFRAANEALLHAYDHAYRSRKLRKRDFRRLWNIRINAAVREKELSYSRFIAALKKNRIELNRKMLSELAVREPETFNQVVESITVKDK